MFKTNEYEKSIKIHRTEKLDKIFLIENDQLNY